jgi:hypothetical protein
MTDDSQSEAEELLQQSKSQRRHTSEPSEGEPTSSGVDRVNAIKQALLSIDTGENPENINIRDKRLKALFIGLEDANELDGIAGELSAVLSSDDPIEDATQSDIARLLIRVGLQEALPEVLEDATEARQKALMEQASDF